MASNRRVATWARRLIDGALVLLVLISLLTMVLARVVPLTGRSTFVVAGGSMAPAIAVGSAVIVEPVAPGSIVAGDVVSLRSGPDRAIFTHRVTRVVDRDGATWVETQGDANPAPDPSLTPATAVIGRVAATVPLMGYLVALMSTPSGIIFVIALGVLLLLVGWMMESPARHFTTVRAPNWRPRASTPHEG